MGMARSRWRLSRAALATVNFDQGSLDTQHTPDRAQRRCDMNIQMGVDPTSNGTVDLYHGHIAIPSLANAQGVARTCRNGGPGSERLG
jgi:hypothetical protein